MSLATIIVVASWSVFLLVWGIGALNVKRDIAHRGLRNASRALWILLIVLCVVLGKIIALQWLGISVSFMHHPLWRISSSSGTWLATQPAFMIVALALCVGGIALAVWARFYLGRNWSSHPALKAEHELVTGGPYAYVRHPIYTGLLAAILGSALTSSPLWLFGFLGALCLFLWRIPVEEELMQKQFPEQYQAYKEHTKALIPFVW